VDVLPEHMNHFLSFEHAIVQKARSDMQVNLSERDFRFLPPFARTGQGSHPLKGTVSREKDLLSPKKGS
jgi:hypothetical protein